MLCKEYERYSVARHNCCLSPPFNLQDVIGRGSKVHPLYARIVEAKAARAIVIPAQPARGLQVPLSCYQTFFGDKDMHGKSVLCSV